MADMEVDSRLPVTMTPTDSSSNSNPCRLTGTNPIYLRDQLQALPSTALGVHHNSVRRPCCAPRRWRNQLPTWGRRVPPLACRRAPRRHAPDPVRPPTWGVDFLLLLFLHDQGLADRVSLRASQRDPNRKGVIVGWCLLPHCLVVFIRRSPCCHGDGV